MRNENNKIRRGEYGLIFHAFLTRKVHRLFMVAPKGHANAKFDVYLCNKFVDCHVKDVKIHKFDVYLCNKFVDFYVKDVKIHKFDVYLCNKFVDVHDKDVKIHKFDVYLCLVIFSFFCTQWPWRDTQTWKSASDIHVCVSQKGHADVKLDADFLLLHVLDVKRQQNPCIGIRQFCGFSRLRRENPQICCIGIRQIYTSASVQKGHADANIGREFFFSKLSTRKISVHGFVCP